MIVLETCRVLCPWYHLFFIIISEFPYELWESILYLNSDSMLYINSFINSPKNSNTPTIFNFEFLKFLYLIYLASQLVLMTPSSYFIEFIFFCYCRLFQAVKKYFSYVLGIVVTFPCSEIYFPLFFSPFFILNETSSD